MARYEVPPDPRESELSVSRKRYMRSGLLDWVSIVSLLLGLVVTLITIFIAWKMANSFLARESLNVQPVTQSTIMALTALPTKVEPTYTPAVATPSLSIIQNEIELPESVEIGMYGQAANTNGVGVTVRSGPSIDNVRLQLLNEGEVALVVGGPQQGDDFTWWQIQLEDGTEGWVASNFLVPTTPPTD